jgi:tRNA pseudouridine38-40 synthase
MRLWALLIEYDGTPFHGWQRQATGLSVQQVLEEAAARLTNGEPCASIAAGRTDAGVHAAGQVAQIGLPSAHDARTVRNALNFHLKPHPIAVLAAVPAPEGWNARFAAIARHYRYEILNRPARPALQVNRVWHVPVPLDTGAMQQAGNVLVGRHDFTSFRAAACQAKSPIRTLDRLRVTREGSRIIIEVSARSFLHHQVRNIAGTLKLVGDGTWPASRVAGALAARDRRAAGPTAPPEGLTLEAVSYREALF